MKTPEEPAAPIRAFVALELGAELRARLAEATLALRAAVGEARFVAADGIHLTLRFLGPSRTEQLERLQPPLQAAARACPPLDASVEGLGMFPERGSPHVLWLGLQAPAALFELQWACEDVARDAGFAPETRPFRPHLTLARWRRPAARPRLPELALGPTRLEKLTLFRSELRPEGARHIAIRSFELGGAAGSAGPA